MIRKIDMPTFDFEASLDERGLRLTPLTVETLQLNITKLCNQACHHCHVDASPKRMEQMDRRTIDRCLEVLAEHPSITTVDITGGAPELHPDFLELVRGARQLGKKVMVRHNLTVTMDPHPRTGDTMRHLPEVFAEHRVEVVSSLPYYQEFFTDKQRGRGVFEKSIGSMRLLNERGIGMDDSDLELNLVYNPVGAYLPPDQESLRLEYRRELHEKFGVSFNDLYAITNMPIHRFRDDLERRGGLEEYMARLVNAFNPAAAEGVMCRSLISVDHDGRLHDCDFNQMLDLPLSEEAPATIFEFDLERLLTRDIRFASHCFGCAAGAGSSCGGATS